MLSSRAAQSTLRATARQFSSVPRAAAINNVRTYATAAAETKPPIALFGIDGTYANALYTASAKTSSLDQTSRALAILSDVFKKDAKLPTILSAPTLSATDKSHIVQELQRVAGGPGKDNILKNFLSTLAENNRLSILQGVCEKFAALMSAHRGEIELIITSAQRLDAKTLQRLEAAVAKSEYSQGKKLKVVPKINPDLVGGLVVEVGDRTVDLSVSSKIAKLNKVLTDTL
ncbi:ATP synthase F1, delta subunit [Paracoccidioides brasiliensis Pb03]|uniref:ATP synthase subunit 5, mitochondrial n=2 Tax=Paracoccidioides brasiliensis TaxID=121759 RepID=C1GIF6_PARBD|nr:ATP synthase F1, delta subunit [Paracoccidioides brasiliensis Pb18]EEH23015.1 ATP synthase F1, delta subunit [Paracoccidioides brasiliensis Pb03]EEH42222.1 ATP synthase F1, delta subunit [Paracoccidioides brasiliensis Pb18]ODH39750.1 ATP synthase F1, delta subunit [Paracoccidioides brasiliensis]